MHAFPKGTRIFIVDDNDAVRDSTGVLLRLEGLDVEIYDAIPEFLRNYRRPEHGCLVLDQHLADTTGIEFLESTEGRGLGIPIVLVTGRGDAALRQRALYNGAAGFLDKPLGEQTLLRTLAAVILGRGAASSTAIH